jgi:LPXTG-motif cell wall-anchored protein
MRKNLRIVATTVLSMMLAVTMSHSTFAASTAAQWTEIKSSVADAEIQITGNQIAKTDQFKAYYVIKEGNGKYVLNTDLITSDVIDKVSSYSGTTYDADSLLAAIKALAPKDDADLTQSNSYTTGQDDKEQTDVVNYLAQALYNVYEEPSSELTDDQTTMLASNKDEIKDGSSNATVENEKVVYKPGKKGTYLIIGDGSVKGTVYLNMLASVMQDGKDQYKGSKIVAKASQPNGSKSITNKTNANGESNQRTNGSDYANESTISGYTDEGAPNTNAENGAYTNTYTPDSKDGKVDSQSNTIGDTINFTLSADVPCYPSDATDTTFYMGDVLGAENYTGLTYVGNIAVKGTNSSGDTDLTEGTDYKVFYFSDYEGKTSVDITAEGKSAADVKAFAIVYDYDKIKGYDTVTATYDTILNENAIIASVGNPNSFKLVYSTNPYYKENYKPGENDDKGNPNPLYPTTKTSWDSSRTDHKYKETSDMSVIYTYSLAVKKIEGGKDSVVLEGAKFNVYANKSGDTLSKLVGTITTDSNGYGVLAGLAQATTYYLQETEAPAGYSLLDSLVEVTLDKANFDTKFTTTTTKKEAQTATTTITTEAVYTADEDEALTDDNGAILATKDGNQLYFKVVKDDSEGAADDATKVTEELTTDATNGDYNNMPAYVKTEATTSSETVYKNGVELTSEYTELTVNETKGALDAVGCLEPISNTKLGALPATGGMGTYIFTIVGVCIMVCAAGLYFVNRKRRNA